MSNPHPILILPFALLLGAMALCPVFAPKWWEQHYPKLALGLGAVTAGIYLFILRDPASLGHAAHEYFSFVTLVGSLFVVSGGIHIGVRGESTPLKNVLFLFTGAVLANVLGTTGAAMLLIRPWLRLNRARVAAHHVVFFIFIVANVGGCLTPIGDPPLFLGFLQGVPFWWVAKNCWPMWAVAVGALLGIFYVVDEINFRRANNKNSLASVADSLAPSDGERAGERGFQPVNTSPPLPDPLLHRMEEREKTTAASKSAVTNEAGGWTFSGLPNLFFLAVILGAVFVEAPPFLREGMMLAAAIGSYFTTKKSVHAANQFSFHPIQEVAVLFAGIFATMPPALAWLNGNAAGVLGASPSPGVFFWAVGISSSVLDNAPTYLGFLGALFGVTADAGDMNAMLGLHSLHILAISVGAVFFGAATYIGNGPNFMVKSIAEQTGVRTPAFGEFVWKFSLPFLLPVLVLVWALFFKS